jgi:adenosylhomocysteine nucleosidase
MIGIIGAMDIEIDHIKSNMTDVLNEKISNMDFYIGKINGKDVVLAKSFEGKVNSAMCTQTMILKYNPSYIINVGVAGAISDKLNIFDIVLAKNAVEFDFDTVVLGYELGYVFGVDKVYMECSDRANSIIKKIAEKENKVYIGNIASSDKFITEESDKKMLRRKFEDVIAVDMESASIAHVCLLNKVEFCSLRIISDGGSDVEFREFVNIAVEKLDKIMFDIVENV